MVEYVTNTCQKPKLLFLNRKRAVCVVINDGNIFNQSLELQGGGWFENESMTPLLKVTSRLLIGLHPVVVTFEISTLIIGFGLDRLFS